MYKGGGSQVERSHWHPDGQGRAGWAHRLGAELSFGTVGNGVLVVRTLRGGPHFRFAAVCFPFFPAGLAAAFALVAAGVEGAFF